MNKTLSLLAATMLLAGAAGAQTIYGNVLQTGGAAAVGQTVYAMTDSTGGMSYYGSGVTGSSGGYSFTLNAMPPAGTMVDVYMYACGMVYSTSIPFNSPDLNANFTICNTAPTNTALAGRIMMVNATGDSVGPVIDGTVYVINKSFDSTMGAYTLSLVDTIHANSSPASAEYYKEYAPGVLPPIGNLLLKAALEPADPNFANGLPTYHANSLSWNTATDVTVNDLNNYGFVLGIQQGVNPGGPGFIAGSVLLGAGKPSGIGDPLSNRTVLLTKENGSSNLTPVGYHVTDASGEFSFSGLAYGTYHIFGDAWGKNNPHLIVTLSAGNDQVTNIQFDENSTGFTGSFMAAGIGNAVNPKLAAIRVSPLPVRDELNIEGLNTVEGAKTITLTSMGGQVIYKANVKAGVDIAIPATGFAPGLYLLDVETTQGNLRMKMAK